MAQRLAMPINHAQINAMYKTDSPGYHERDEIHYGVDMTGWHNPFFTSGVGTVVGVGGAEKAGCGYFVAVKYDNVYQWNMSNSTLKTIPSVIMRYFHLAAPSSLRVGNSVNLDTIIGTYGKTGAWWNKMDPHLHVEVDTDINYPLYTPTLSVSSGGLYAGYRGSADTTIDPISVLFVKESGIEDQNVTYRQDTCDPNHLIKPANTTTCAGGKLYINIAKIAKLQTKTF